MFALQIKKNRKDRTLPSRRSVFMFQWPKSAFFSSFVPNKSSADRSILWSIHKADNFTDPSTTTTHDNPQLVQTVADSRCTCLISNELICQPLYKKKQSQFIPVLTRSLAFFFYFNSEWDFLLWSKKEIRVIEPPTVKFPTEFPFRHGMVEILAIFGCCAA